MAKFKVGDKVRLIGYEHHKVRRSDQLEVTDIDTLVYEDRIKWRFDGYESSWDGAQDYTLVTPAQPSELEQLVTTANEGRVAAIKLNSFFSDQIQHRDGEPFTAASTARIEIKRRPAFEPFTVGQGWRVELRGTDRVAVGCQEFSIKDLTQCLRVLCSPSSNTTYTFPDGKSAWPTRYHIVYNGHNNLPWSDADRLLEALRKLEAK